MEMNMAVLQISNPSKAHLQRGQGMSAAVLMSLGFIEADGETVMVLENSSACQRWALRFPRRSVTCEYMEQMGLLPSEAANALLIADLRTWLPLSIYVGDPKTTLRPLFPYPMTTVQ